MNIQSIIDQLHTVAEPSRKEASKTMFPTSMEVLGATTPAMRELMKEWWFELKHLPPEELLKFSKQLVQTRVFECNQLAFELLWKNKNALGMVGLKDIEELGQNIDNWATVDTLSVLIAGQAWRENRISDQDVLKWLKSENRWWRRMAVVSTVPLNLKSRGGSGDSKRTLLICKKVVNERDDMIVKALSWALRELSKSDKQSVVIFMDKYDSHLAGRVKREVHTKLETGRKNG